MPATSQHSHPSAAPSRPVTTIVPDFNRDVVCLLGMPFDRVSLADAQARVRNAIAENRRCHIATPNVNLMRIAGRDAAFRRALVSADLSLVDGMPLVWMARLLGLGITERAAGSDLFEALGRDQEQAIRTYFFGGTESVCAELKRKLGDRIAGVRCIGAHAPGFGDVASMSAPSTLAAINVARPELLVVAVSARKGLQWIHRNEMALSVPVLANLGATVHFAAGTVKRAPEHWRRLGVEWLWRIRQEPELWSRYAADFGFLLRAVTLHAVPALVMRLLRGKRRGAPAHVQIRAGDTAAGRSLRLSGAFTGPAIELLRAALSSALRTQGPLTIDLEELRHIDAEGLGLLLLAYGHQARIGQRLTFHGANWRVRRLLAIHGCAYLLNTPVGATAKPAPRPELVNLKSPRGMAS